MRKILLLLLLLPLLGLGQTANNNTDVIRQGTIDGRHSRLGYSDAVQIRAHRIDYTSDRFKPSTANVSNPELLKDSAYVTAFRRGALKKASHHRTLAHYVLWTPVVLIGVIFIEFAVISIGGPN